jgi:hypothetical protein
MHYHSDGSSTLYIVECDCRAPDTPDQLKIQYLEDKIKHLEEAARGVDLEIKKLNKELEEAITVRSK